MALKWGNRRPLAVSLCRLKGDVGRLSAFGISCISLVYWELSFNTNILFVTCRNVSVGERMHVTSYLMEVSNKVCTYKNKTHYGVMLN